ncbi:MAG: hypothetical protein Q9227_007116 [Pyrenula ochraceoflavens]
MSGNRTSSMRNFWRGEQSHRLISAVEHWHLATCDDTPGTKAFIYIPEAISLHPRYYFGAAASPYHRLPVDIHLIIFSYLVETDKHEEPFRSFDESTGEHVMLERIWTGNPDDLVNWALAGSRTALAAATIFKLPEPDPLWWRLNFWGFLERTGLMER